MDKIEFIRNHIEKLDINISEEQCCQFLKYYEMLVEKNKVMNLTGITEFEEVIEKHFVDSLSLVKSIKLNGDESLIDVGTGAGFPGIPIKIMFPNLKITLMDSLNKRLLFLNEVTNKLGLDKIELVHGRAEDLGKNSNYREKYDLCVSRAVANISTLSEYCIPFIKLNGYFICYKADGCMNEINIGKNAIKVLGGEIEEIVDFNLPDTDIKRKIINIKKIKNTPKKYPRKPGLPSKEPII
ncbi:MULTISPECIES: 16S rRNA (guanine(527)-N(7))-methyltransferase RsmG [Eubacterium]|uniref:Ribosomal RNA small subunit methyltransferase G n=1 Tax=Eubacterium album TaxID=2978477 RepID=A0ABT2M313_9FIRM|nr:MULTISPECIES: 16S rRNA (guanine(527)-N(7))-methyltransferase RsmG [unclassified Eubacterium (in: firmicutes)]MCT7398648.1 16S rRNA (guanine(527)-N(7))-methyltransferase RsmG [Eubacterium sp. LFL-14]